MEAGRDLLWRGVPKRAIGGLIVGLIPFVVTCSETITRTGGLCIHRDYAAVLGGGIAAIIGVSILTMSPIPILHRIGYMVLLAAIGAAQVARGLGYIGGPCN